MFKNDNISFKNNIFNVISDIDKNSTIVILLDLNTKISDDFGSNLNAIASDYNIYILTSEDSFEYQNIKKIDFYNNLDDKYLMPDKIHLTKQGNERLNNLLISTLKKTS